MKLISALSFLVAGVAAAPGDYTGGDDRYHVHKNLALGFLGVNVDEDGNQLKDIFEFQAVHREADTPAGETDWLGRRYAYLFRECPHGKAQKWIEAGSDMYLGQIEDPSTMYYQGDQPAWIETILPFVTTHMDGTAFSSSYHFTVKPTIAEADIGYGGDYPVYTPDLDNNNPFRVLGGEANFCIFFGIGDVGTSGNEIFGFREIKVKSKFIFDGVFKMTSFQTQAYDPVTGAAVSEETWETVAENCSPKVDEDPETDYNPLAPGQIPAVKPGMPVCVEICPKPNLGDVFVEYVNSMFITQSPDDTSAPNGGEPSALDPLNPENPGVILYDAVIYPTTTITCDAGPDGNGVFGDGNVDSMSQPVSAYCCNVLFILPARYFPTDGSTEEPQFSQFLVSGDVNVLPVTSNAGIPGVNPALPNGPVSSTGGGRRLGKKTRALQATSGSKAPLNGEVGWTLVAEDHEESSAMTAATGVAAAAALGAALFL